MINRVCDRPIVSHCIGVARRYAESSESPQYCTFCLVLYFMMKSVRANILAIRRWRHSELNREQNVVLTITLPCQSIEQLGGSF
jgi:hypothetical protein